MRTDPQADAFTEAVREALGGRPQTARHSNPPKRRFRAFDFVLALVPFVIAYAVLTYALVRGTGMA
jgi:hypothetical protein